MKISKALTYKIHSVFVAQRCRKLNVTQLIKKILINIVAYNTVDILTGKDAKGCRIIMNASANN